MFFTNLRCLLKYFSPLRFAHLFDSVSHHITTYIFLTGFCGVVCNVYHFKVPPGIHLSTVRDTLFLFKLVFSLLFSAHIIGAGAGIF